MNISRHIYNWISRNNHNLPLIALLTFSFPRSLLKAIYNHNRGRYNWKGKKACVTISFDCDYPEDVEAIPSLLKTLDRYPFKTSFACVGYWIEKYPREHELILEHGHEIMNHTYTHPDNDILTPGRKFKLIPREEKKEEIVRCHEICRRVLGYEPKGLRVPHFKHLFTDEIYGILKEIGYTYSSSTWVTGTATYGQPFREKHGIIEFPLSNCLSHPFTVFDTWHSLNAQRLSHRLKHCGPESYCRLFEDLLTLGEETGSYINIYMDPLDIKKLSGFEKILDHLSDTETFWVATYEELLKDLPESDIIKNCHA